MISRNLIGTDDAGMSVVGQGWDGVRIQSGANNTIVEDNTIAGHRNVEVSILSSGTSNNTVKGNRIGVDLTGTMRLGSSRYGILVRSSDNTIGGDEPGDGNVISGASYGVMLSSQSAAGNVVSGNFIGVDKDGESAELGMRAGVTLSNGSMSSNTNNEGAIRRTLIERDLVECMVALPGQLFTNTQIPACIWFLTKNKQARTSAAGRALADRSGKVLFIDARNLGYMKDRVLRDFKQSDLDEVTETFHSWQVGEGYEDVPGFCKNAELAVLEKHDFVLTPGRYVGAVAKDEDGEPFADKMARLTSTLKEQFEESSRLETEIKKNLAGLGYDV